MNLRAISAAIVCVIGCVISILHPAAATNEATTALPLFEARYRVNYKGRDAGSLLERLSYDETTSTYQFTSSMQFDGLFRLAAGGDTNISSRFVLDDGHVVPLSYSAATGQGADDHVEFDWTAASATGATGAPMRVEQGTVDPGSLRVEVMATMMRIATPDTITVFDGRELSTHHLTQLGREQLDSPFGPLSADLVVEQRDGSSRATHLWLAPKLCYLPVRMMRSSEDATQIDIRLESVSGIAPSSSDCRD
jgi:hypothetical protein